MNMKRMGEEEELIIKNSDYKQLSRYDLAMIACLVKSLKPLQKFTIPKENSEETAEVIKDTVRNYPHISNVKVNYCN